MYLVVKRSTMSGTEIYNLPNVPLRRCIGYCARFDAVYSGRSGDKKKHKPQSPVTQDHIPTLRKVASLFSRKSILNRRCFIESGHLRVGVLTGPQSCDRLVELGVGIRRCVYSVQSTLNRIHLSVGVTGRWALSSPLGLPGQVEQLEVLPLMFRWLDGEFSQQVFRLFSEL